MASIPAIGLGANFEPQPMFDRRTRLIYAIIGFELLLDVVLYWLLGLRIEVPVWDLLLGLATVTASAFAARRIGLGRIATWLEASALTYGQGLVGWALLYPATVFALPYADWWLSAADKALGFNFPALYRATHDWPLPLMYRSFDWQPAVVIPLLVLFRRDVWPMVLALSVALLVTIPIYPFATGLGPVTYYHLGLGGGWAPVIEAVRDHGVRTITPTMLVGMVSLPSFHAATGVILIWSTWPVKPLRWPFLAINAAMIFATIPFGQHYLIDVIAGIAVAIFAILLARPSKALRWRREPGVGVVTGHEADPHLINITQ